MPTRELTASIITAIQSDIVRPILFILADFPSGNFRVWTGSDDILWNGNT